jgi:hypothetical protein
MIPPIAGVPTIALPYLPGSALVAFQLLAT